MKRADPVDEARREGPAADAGDSALSYKVGIDGGKVFRGFGVRIGCQVYIAPHCSGLLVGDFVRLTSPSEFPAIDR